MQDAWRLVRKTFDTLVAWYEDSLVEWAKGNGDEYTIKEGNGDSIVYSDIDMLRFMETKIKESTPTLVETDARGTK